MNRSLAFLPFAVFALAPSLALAAPCAADIDATQAQIDSALNQDAANGKTGDQTVAATDHRQPTAASIAAAEARLGEGHFVGKALAALDVARKADAQGDAAACHAAVAEAEKDLGAKSNP